MGDLALIGRYIVAGVVNTVLTATLLAILAILSDPTIAYTIAFFSGLALGTISSGLFVLRSRLAVTPVALFVSGYGIVFVLGLLVVDFVLTPFLPSFGTAAVVFVTAPLGYLVGRRAFGPGSCQKTVSQTQGSDVSLHS